MSFPYIVRNSSKVLLPGGQLEQTNMVNPSQRKDLDQLQHTDQPTLDAISMYCNSQNRPPAPWAPLRPTVSPNYDIDNIKSCNAIPDVALLGIGEIGAIRTVIGEPDEDGIMEPKKVLQVDLINDCHLPDDFYGPLSPLMVPAIWDSDDESIGALTPALPAALTRPTLPTQDTFTCPGCRASVMWVAVDEPLHEYQQFIHRFRTSCHCAMVDGNHTPNAYRLDAPHGFE